MNPIGRIPFGTGTLLAFLVSCRYTIVLAEWHSAMIDLDNSLSAKQVSNGG